MGGLEVDDLRTVPGRVQPERRARANVRFAEGKRAGHHEIRWLRFRQQTLALDPLSSRRGGSAAVGQTGQTCHQPQDDVSHRRSSAPHPAAGATRGTHDGKLVSLQHDYVNHHAILDDYHEDCGEATAFHYSVPNLQVKFGRARRNVGSPTAMRGPGAVPGLYATESAMNELADQLKIDPVRLRVMNEPKIDEWLGIPFSSRHFLECFELGAEKLGWSKRNPEVGSMKRDGLTLGWGMAGCTWIAATFSGRGQCPPSRRWHRAGRLRDAGYRHRHLHDPRPACREKTGVPLDKVEVALGDTSLPEGPLSGGSMVTGSVIPAVFKAADNAIESLLKTATTTPGIAIRKAQAGRSGLRRRPGFCEGRRSCRAVCHLPICCGAPTSAWSPAAANPKGRSVIQSRSSRPIRSAVILSKSPGSRRSRACASVVSLL